MSQLMLYSESSRSHIGLSNKSGNTEKYYNHILKLLVGLNEKRVRNLKKLYTLNNYNFGKESLRNLIKNAKGYDDLIKSIDVVLKEINDNSYDDPNHVLNLYRTNNLNIRNGNNFKQEDSSYDVSDSKKNEEDNISDKMSIADGNIINALRYYYFICSNSRKKCKKACRKSYKRLCSRYDCSNNFESNMEDSCRKACRKHFSE
ncbi:uncharacterized protein LOC126778575 isoform X2 [Nymphalis io]|uniref:uncharacterized protein LOC126778575 isoform X2 n=1 Tax=Inachis io TaxID=171585 RepID=UPI0021682352|nr:uncharacterized protein LOC126778575 isoform X2 [Nymphalis io]